MITKLMIYFHSEATSKTKKSRRANSHLQSSVLGLFFMSSAREFDKNSINRTALFSEVYLLGLENLSVQCGRT